MTNTYVPRERERKEEEEEKKDELIRSGSISVEYRTS
jgi:hypothetical protein